MLKKYTLLFIFLSVFSFLTISDFYNSSMVEKIGQWKNSKTSTQIAFKNTDEIDPIKFVDYFREVACKYNLTIVQQLNNDTNNSTSLYITSSNKQYMDNILLREGKINSLTEFDSFDTNNTNSKARIYNLNFEENISILPLKYDGVMSPFGYFGIYTSSGNPIDEDTFRMVKKDILKEYSDIEINFQEYNVAHDGLKEVKLSRFISSFVINMLISILFTLVMITDILKEQVKINVMKLEGYSNFKIFKEIILNNLCIAYLVYLMSFIIIFKINVPFGFSKVIELYQLSLTLAVMNLFMVISFSYILFLFVKFVPINVSVKGKSFLSVASNTVVFVKLILVILTIPLIIQSSIEVSGLMNRLINEEKYIKRFENLYKIANVSSSSSINTLFDSEEFSDIVGRLRNETKAFYFMTQYEASSNPNLKNKYLQYYVVDRQYLENQDIKIMFDEISDNSVLIHQNVAIDDKRHFLENCSMQHLGSVKEIEYIRYLGKMENFSDLYFYDDLYIKNNPIFLLESDYIKYNGLYNMYFYYDGDRIDAQNYINSKFEQYNIKEPYYISSVSEKYENFITNSIIRNFKGLLTTFLLILIYLVVSYQYLSLSFNSSIKQTFIEKTEGIRIPQFIRKSITLSSVIIFLYSFLFIYSYGYMDTIVITNVGVILFVEIILNVIFLKKISKLKGRYI